VSAHLRRLASSLNDAWAHHIAIPAPTRHHPSLTVEDAYAIQDLVIEERVKEGRRKTGWKMGLTSAGPGTTPIVGTLLDDMVVPSGSEIPLAATVAPMVEAELVVHIGETIDREVTIDDLRSGPHRVGPGIEVVDYRTLNSSGPIDWVADNSTVAFAVVGPTVPLGKIDLADVEASLMCADRLLASGSGRQVMGDPLAAVAWLSGHLSDRGLRLDRDDVILTGSLTGHHPVAECEQPVFTGDFGGLGVATVKFGR